MKDHTQKLRHFTTIIYAWRHFRLFKNSFDKDACLVWDVSREVTQRGGLSLHGRQHYPVHDRVHQRSVNGRN